MGAVEYNGFLFFLFFQLSVLIWPPVPWYLSDSQSLVCVILPAPLRGRTVLLPPLYGWGSWGAARLRACPRVAEEVWWRGEYCAADCLVQTECWRVHHGMLPAGCGLNVPVLGKCSSIHALGQKLLLARQCLWPRHLEEWESYFPLPTHGVQRKESSFHLTLLALSNALGRHPS